MQADKGRNNLVVEFLTHSSCDPGMPAAGAWRWGGEPALSPQVGLRTLDE